MNSKVCTSNKMIQKHSLVRLQTYTHIHILKTVGIINIFSGNVLYKASASYLV